MSSIEPLPAGQSLSSPAPLPSVLQPGNRHWLWACLAAPLLLLVLLLGGVASCFHLSSDTRALRDELTKASGVGWRQRVALNVGAVTLSAVRAALSWARLDAEARTALQAVRGAEVGIYQLPSGAVSPDRAAMLAAADSIMSARGWGRVVGVRDAKNLVAVYVPAKNVSARRMKCCVIVFDGRELVLASARANLEPLVQYALGQPGLRSQAWMQPFPNSMSVLNAGADARPPS